MRGHLHVDAKDDGSICIEGSMSCISTEDRIRITAGVLDALHITPDELILAAVWNECGIDKASSAKWVEADFDGLIEKLKGGG